MNYIKEGNKVTFTIPKNPIWTIIETYGTEEDKEEYKHLVDKVEITIKE